MMTDYDAKLDEMLEASAGQVAYIPGRALGRKPKFFIIGDSPSVKDTLTRMPFSGALGEVLANALQTLNKRYGSTDKECYITYLVKIPVARNEITRDMIERDWLEIAQLEFQLSGCESVVALGAIAKTYAGHIPMRPSFMGKDTPTLMEKIQTCFQILRK